jgi:hypothetical protein
MQQNKLILDAFESFVNDDRIGKPYNAAQMGNDFLEYIYDRKITRKIVNFMALLKVQKRFNVYYRYNRDKYGREIVLLPRSNSDIDIEMELDSDIV